MAADLNSILMDSTLWATVAGFVAGVVSWSFGKKDARTDRAFTMHAEFNNFEFSRARKKCADLLTKHYDQTLEQIGRISPKVPVHEAWFVIRFYQRLWVAIHHNKINAELVPDLFGEIFFWWYHVHFEGQLCGLSYQSAKEIKKLKGWFDENAKEDLKTEWNAWGLAEKKALEASTRKKCPTYDAAPETRHRSSLATFLDCLLR
jgi:hypothetical protein